MRSLSLKLALAAALTLAPGLASAETGTIRIGTGGLTGVYYPTGTEICGLLNAGKPAPVCEAVSSGGSVANIEAVRDGTFTFGIAQSDVVAAAYAGEGAFADAEPYRDLRVLFSLHAEALQVLVAADSDIKTVADLRGKRVNVGNPGSGTRVLTDMMLASAGMGVSALGEAAELETADQSKAICDRTLDAVTIVAGLPNGLAMEATINCATRLLDLRSAGMYDLMKANRAFAEVRVPGGTYPGNPADVVTWGPRAVVVVDASTSAEEVGMLVEAVFDNIRRLRRSHPALQFLDLSEMKTQGLSAPLHPGVAEYLFN
ncbi:TAXI family TRAP transporter solute-binding subunit [Jannaschia formosa]|uniref:TAXI family TRAP transporter solute-binding subunit n=1 Tax=Jannaschia formosa TaxID=2259592 RepID=UPI000E1C11AF|nr:TAXI family TRAP transporter solute-binding subunit [Jannaschia formosa]TFL19716.1 TAXI family TRAP transporter solute-binding subunit [Jannaschia formosa]